MKQIILLIGLTVSVLTFGQESKTTDFSSEIQNFNISDLWSLDKIQTEFEGEKSERERPEPLGYIGDNFQRFYIHFISVIQNPDNKIEYFVYGKTRVKTNICSFQGLITIKEAKTYIESEVPPLKQGFVTGVYKFYEDSEQKGTGILNGEFQTNFFIDSKGRIRYDALSLVADGYKNNQFQGQWTSYITGDSKKCNWGDYRIPDSKRLDGGVGEFGPVEKYNDYGWASYRLAWGYSSDKPEVVQAREKEAEKWWIETDK